MVIPEHPRDFLTDATDLLLARELRELREGRYSASMSRTFDHLHARQQEAKCAQAEAQLEDELIIHVLQDV